MTRFLQPILLRSPGLDLLLIPHGFGLYLGTIPRTITLKTNTGCNWMVRLKDVNGRVATDQGWPGFAIGHNSQDQHRLFLDLQSPQGDIYRVTIFDYSLTGQEVPEHDLALSMIDE
jgi:hypothetical protein